MTNDPHVPVNDLQQVTARHCTARQMAEALAAHHPADIWQYLLTALADAPAFTAEIIQLRTALAETRLDRANLAAAALACIAAHREGEPDPLSYLRDELRAQGYELARGQR